MTLAAKEQTIKDTRPIFLQVLAESLMCIKILNFNHSEEGHDYTEILVDKTYG